MCWNLDNCRLIELKELTVQESEAVPVPRSGHGGHDFISVQHWVVLEHLAEHGAIDIRSTEDVHGLANSNAQVIRQCPCVQNWVPP
jgi:hypothetical protein